MRLTDENYENDVLSLKNKTQEEYNKELWEYAKPREDIEEELGIDLITLYKLFKAKKVFSFSNCGVWEVSNIGINLYFKTITIWNGSCHQTYPLNEYGKSFALTKEELL